jgi:plastocyanin
VLGLSTATVVLGTVLVAPSAGADSGGRGDTQRVRLSDDCEAASFNAAVGPDTCVGDGETTFQDFVAQLLENGLEANESADDWEFKPEDFHIDHGDRLRVVNQGGEFHTFTEVAQFGPGCVGQINVLLGLDGAPVDECRAFPAVGGVLAGQKLTVDGLAPGTHRFECLVHPWMQSVVEVRHDDR